MKEFLVFLGLTITFILLFIFIDLDTVNTYYEDYEHATNNGVISPDSWLPQFLPKSARNIRERANIDTHEVWVSFSFDKIDTAYLTSACSISEKPDIKFPREDRSRAIDWWIKDAEKDNGAKLKYFRCDDNSFLITNELEQIAFFWRHDH